MSNINTACLKISRDGVFLEAKRFIFAYQRDLWLYNNKFLPSNGVFIHQDGRVAGKFTDSNTDGDLTNIERLRTIMSFNTCDKPISSHKSMWCDILGA
jgi:hypothetical protein